MKRIFLRAIPFILFCGCISNDKTERQKIRNEFDSVNTIYNFEGLNLIARFAECGEFGGHREKIAIAAEGQSLQCTYSVFPFNCDSLDYYRINGERVSPISVRTRTVGNRDLGAIKEYLGFLNRAWTDRQNGLPGGEVYSAVGKDSSLVLVAYGHDERNRQAYKKLVAALFP
ncbi:hypothetical protein [Flaviaesturariibacter aridisoli]|uniref:Uncharacterized protein n=1 Tax=Flaviaesturariibacter aridisoli TaxID=2545761 RepID=A0A4R4DWL0_9BACT|nr:hypothetical protein [Flaviaesturariibacter aridisoli]TCZ66931.1 hypothetical protein E0486_16420 [Flaviaesturariibacter aridisoli]